MKGQTLKKLCKIAIIPLLMLSQPLQAHEFWLNPVDYTLDYAEELVVEIRVGQDFKGNEFSYNPNQFYDFSLTDQTGKMSLEGRLGDQPAVRMTPPNDGLIVLNHFSTSMLLEYKDDGKFESFLESAGLDGVLERHLERGLPLFGFKEAYTRFAKSLIAVGDGAGQDSLTGMPLELLALANPYTDDVENGLPIRLYWNGSTVPNIKIKVFHRLEGSETVEESYVTTDISGSAVIPIDGPGDYLINGVHMIQPSAADIERTEAVWHSLWGSMTFSITN